MADHIAQRKIIRKWMALATDKRQTEDQTMAFAKKTVQQNEFHGSRRDTKHQFRRSSYQKVLGWLVPRVGKA